MSSFNIGTDVFSFSSTNINFHTERFCLLGKICYSKGCKNLRDSKSAYCLSCRKKRKESKKVVLESLPICPLCGKAFPRNSNRQIFCGAECRKRAEKLELKFDPTLSELIEKEEEGEPFVLEDVECKCPRCKEIYIRKRIPEPNGTRPWEYCEKCKEKNRFVVNGLDPNYYSIGDTWEDEFTTEKQEIINYENTSLHARSHSHTR